MEMVLVVGLGNPGTTYRFTRHNTGFMVLDALAKRIGCRLNERRHNAVTGRGDIGGTPVVLAKPLTYMNRSGRAVAALLSDHGLSESELIVIHDDLDMDSGKIRIKRGGGHGGHNGLRSIMACLGRGDFRRLKIGIGRPPHGVSAEAHVLEEFSAPERDALPETLSKAADAVMALAVEPRQVAAAP